MLDIKIVKNEIILSGLLNEQIDGDQLASALKTARSNSDKQVIIANFDQVSRCNSIGILIWLRAISTITSEIVYRNCPVHLTEQFSSVTQFIGRNCRVESFYVRYHCPEADEFMVRKLIVGEDVPLLPNYGDFEIPNLVIGDKIFEPDFIPADYFSFLSNSFGKR